MILFQESNVQMGQRVVEKIPKDNKDLILHKYLSESRRYQVDRSILLDNVLYKEDLFHDDIHHTFREEEEE
jgi:hypothetical protein